MEKKQITPGLIENKLTQALDATLVKAEDLSDGCGMKFSILIVSPRFDGMPLVERHRAVHAALEKETPDIHALTLKCLTPQQHQAATAS
ncbi:bola-like protein [Guillardia theta CCMP2712]|uniref:Bola-like protein n=3 Tax=Guillardia theta TaxID=55529 RepID=L1J6P1_GUITC|nr:bola-like protein [Guillardia theta CCMP2712]EKX44213.1 bola-like protein [Guillardia theta CCMP2712]|eukprot:XP_005831193.1 bola-like protein [Guillardia theta CCMP2712]